MSTRAYDDPPAQDDLVAGGGLSAQDDLLAYGDLSTYADVPDAGPDAVVDPHWQDLQLGSGLPTAYLPTTTGGPIAPWRRVAAWVIIVLLVSVTAAGICLTYGPAELFTRG